MRAPASSADHLEKTGLIPLILRETRHWWALLFAGPAALVPAQDLQVNL